MLFDTEITLTGPWRSPAQMLAEQSVAGRRSVHDGDMDAALGLAGAHKSDGTPVLIGTASIGPDRPPSEPQRRLERAAGTDPGELFVIDQLAVEMGRSGDVVTVGFGDSNGAAYPFHCPKNSGALPKHTRGRPLRVRPPRRGGADRPYGDDQRG